MFNRGYDFGSGLAPAVMRARRRTGNWQPAREAFPGAPERANVLQKPPMSAASCGSPAPVSSNRSSKTNGTSEPWKAPHFGVSGVFTLLFGTCSKEYA